jgi:hypothetical protein
MIDLRSGGSALKTQGHRENDTLVIRCQGPAKQVRKEVPNCGCFGRYFPQRLGPGMLLEDAGFFVLALIACQDAERAKRGQPS